VLNTGTQRYSAPLTPATSNSCASWRPSLARASALVCQVLSAARCALLRVAASGSTASAAEYLWPSGRGGVCLVAYGEVRARSQFCPKVPAKRAEEPKGLDLRATRLVLRRTRTSAHQRRDGKRLKLVTHGFTALLERRNRLSADSPWSAGSHLRRHQLSLRGRQAHDHIGEPGPHAPPMRRRPRPPVAHND